jgi:hypothetical protein
MGSMATGTRKGTPVCRRGREVQQFGQRCCTSLMQGRAHSHLDGFQVQPSRPSATVEDDAQ